MVLNATKTTLIIFKGYDKEALIVTEYDFKGFKAYWQISIIYNAIGHPNEQYKFTDGQNLGVLFIET